MTGIPTTQMSTQVTKGVTIAGSSTGLALVINWVWKLKYGSEIPPEVAIVLAGFLGFAAGRIWNLIEQILKKRGIDLEGE